MTVTVRDRQLVEFCEAEFPRLVASLTLYCGDRFVAEELAQDALVRAVSNWGRVAKLNSPGGWVHRVAINLANSWFRRRRAQLRAHARLTVDGGGASGDAMADIAAVAEELRRLPRRQREALVLRHVVGLSAEEVGVILDCSPQAVRNLCHRATADLRRHLADGVTEAP